METMLAPDHGHLAPIISEDLLCPEELLKRNKEGAQGTERRITQNLTKGTYLPGKWVKTQVRDEKRGLFWVGHIGNPIKVMGDPLHLSVSDAIVIPIG